MKDKRNEYMAPSVEVMRLRGECLLDSLSMKVSNDPAVGGGDAKGNNFFEDEDEDGGTVKGTLWREL